MDSLRQVLDTASARAPRYAAKPGMTEDVVREISAAKGEPEWMLEKRLQGLKLFQETALPAWGPDLSSIDFDALVYFVRPDAQEEKSWDKVPEEIRETFDKLGIPKAEQEVLAGAGAQFDSEIVYHNLKAEWAEQGVIFLNMEDRKSVV